MNLTGFDLGAWLTKSGAVVLVTDYECATQIFTGYAVHPMREVRYRKDGRLVSCCFLPGESQTVEHEQQLHDCLHLDRKLDDDMAVVVVNSMEWNHLVRSREVGATMTRMLVESGEPVAQAPHEDWVEITDPNHVLRPNIDWLNQDGLGWWLKITGGESTEKVRADCPSSQFRFRCLRHHHPDFAPARRQDSAGAGIYDEVPPPIHPEINEEKLKEVATLDDPLGRFNVPELPAEPEVIPPTEYRFHICTAESDWNLRGTHFEWSGDSLAVYLCDECVAWIRNATSCTRENPYPGPKPAVPTVTVDLLHPLGDTLDHLYRLITHGVSSVAEKDAVKACVERFDNLVKTVRGG